MTRSLPVLVLTLAGLFPAEAADPPKPAGDPIRTVDHRVKHRTNVPNFEGTEFELAVRERVPTEPNGLAVLCVHGLTIPGGPVFDLPHKDYSWLRSFADAGFRAFAVDLTGYGASTRPDPMNDPRNLDGLDRFVVKVPSGPRPYPYLLTTADSDLHDIDTAVEFVRKEARVDRVHLVGTSLGGGRVLVYASRHPGKVGRVVVQGWGIASEVDQKPEKLPPSGAPVTVTTGDGFRTRWRLMARGKDQVEPGMPELVWAAIQATDHEGAKWGPGVCRSPGIALWGWNKAVFEGVKAPVLLHHGEFDPLDPAGTALFDKLATPEKVNLTQKNVSHVPYWETGKDHLFRVSLEWIAKGTAGGRKTGVATVAADGRFEWK